MEGEKFEFGSIPEGSQETRIENPEKAQEMALAQNAVEDFAYAYEEFLKDPEAFQESQSIELDEDASNASEVFKNVKMMEEFDRLQEQDYSPDDVRSWGNREAEIVGDVFDYSEGLKEKSKTALRLEYAKAFGSMFANGILLLGRQGHTGEQMPSRYTPGDSERFKDLLHRFRGNERKIHAIYTAMREKKEE